MPWERFDNYDQPNEAQNSAQGLTPTTADWQNFNAVREGSSSTANQYLPNPEITGINMPAEPVAGAAPSAFAGASEGGWTANGGAGTGANNGWFGGGGGGGSWENSASGTGEGGGRGWHHPWSQSGGGFGGGDNGGSGDLLVDKLLSDPTMLQSMQGLQGQMTSQGFSALEQSLTQNLSMNPYTSDSALMQQAYQQLSGMGASSQDLTALQNLLGGDSTGTTTTAATGGDSTGTSTGTGTGSASSTDPIIQQFSQSDPELAQILTDTQAQMSPQGYSQFEQTVAQNWATGQSPDDATLLQQSLSQFQQQGGSAADVSAASNVIQSDLQNYGDSAVSTYQGGSSTGTSTGTGGDSGAGTTTTTSGTGGDSGTGTTTTTSGTGGDSGTGTTTTTSVTGGDGTGTSTTTPTTGGDGTGTTTTTPTTGGDGTGTTTTTSTIQPTTSSSGPDVPAGTAVPSNLVLSDSFNTGSLNTSLWSPTWFGNGNTQNSTVMESSNVSEGANGLNLKDTGSTGAIVSTNPDDGQPGHTGFQMTNGYVQFTVDVPPSSNGQIANWPGFWLVGQEPWPEDGEIDVMEGLSGNAAWHEHYGSDSAVGAAVNTKPGENTYGVDITPTELTYYYDGQEVGQAPNEAPNSPKFIVMENSNMPGYTVTPDTATVQNVSVWE